MGGRKRLKKYEEIYRKYLEGFSLAEVGKMFGLARQTIFNGFQRRGYTLRTKKKLPFITFNKIKFTLRNHGYYARTDGDRGLLHRYIWEYYKGKIPEGYDVHHKDEDKTHNEISNFECLPKAEHTKKYSPSCNQFGHKCKKYVNDR